MLHGSFQQFGFAVGADGNRAIAVAREFTAVDKFS
jgi:hypothetical protein